MPDYAINWNAANQNQAVEAPTQATPGYGDAHIEKVQNGFLITIGCKRFVMHTWKEVSDGLELYWKDPQKARVIYCPEEYKAPPTIRRVDGIPGNRRRKVGRTRKNK